MNKFLFIVFCLLYFRGSTQIVTALLNPDVEVLFFAAAYAGATDPGPSGDFQFWDYSSLSDSATLVYTYVDPSKTPYDIFDNTSIALTTDDSTFTYYNTSTEKWTIAGYGSEAFILFYFDEQDLFEYNFSPGSVFDDHFAGAFNYSGIDIHRSGDASFLADGSGTLLLPFTDFIDVVRVKYVETITDSFFIAGGLIGTYETIKTNYIWVDYVTNTIVLTIELKSVSDGTSTTATKHITYRTSMPTGTMDEFTGRPVVELYYADGFLHVSSDNPKDIFSISLIDIVGNQLMSSTTPLTGKDILPVPALSPGIYLATLYGPYGITTKKVWIQ